MPKPDFVHLHLHTEYSLLDSTIRHAALMDQVAAHGSKAVGVTDHGNMFGAISFYEAATAKGLKPILGCELYVAPGSRFDRTSGGVREAGYHLTVLATNATGYSNLCRLVTAGYLEGFYCRPRVDLDLLERHHDGLIVLSGCPAGEVSQQLAQHGQESAMRVVERYRDIFGDRYYLEIQRNEVTGQQRINKELTDTLRVLEQLAAIDLTLALLVGIHNGLGVRPVARFAKAGLRADWLPRLAAGRKLASYALTEPAAGSHPSGIRTTAIRDGRGWRIRGEKSWIGVAAWAGLITVIARATDEHGTSLGTIALAVPQDTPGLRHGPEALTLGMRGIVQNTVHLDSVWVPDENVLGEVGGRARRSTRSSRPLTPTSR